MAELTVYLDAVRARLAKAPPAEGVERLQEFKNHPLCKFERDYLKPVVGYLEGQLTDSRTDLARLERLVRVGQELANTAQFMRDMYVDYFQDKARQQGWSQEFVEKIRGILKFMDDALARWQAEVQEVEDATAR